MRGRGGRTDDPRFWFGDEEPERDYIDYDAIRAMRTGDRGVCNKCGLGHPDKECPDLYLHIRA